MCQVIHGLLQLSLKKLKYVFLMTLFGLTLYLLSGLVSSTMLHANQDDGGSRVVAMMYEDNDEQGAGYYSSMLRESRFGGFSEERLSAPILSVSLLVWPMWPSLSILWLTTSLSSRATRSYGCCGLVFILNTKNTLQHQDYEKK